MFVLNNQHSLLPKTEMQVKTILHSVTDDKSFVFGKIYSATTEGTDQAVVVEIKPRKNSKPVCSQCGNLMLDSNCDIENTVGNTVPF